MRLIRTSLQVKTELQQRRPLRSRKTVISTFLICTQLVFEPNWRLEVNLAAVTSLISLVFNQLSGWIDGQSREVAHGGSRGQHALPFRLKEISATCLRDRFFFRCEWLRSVRYRTRLHTHSKARWFAPQRRSLKTPGAPLFSMHSRNHHVGYPLCPPGSLTARCQWGPVGNLMASSSSVKRWRRMRQGGSPAAECHRSAWPRPQRGSRGAVWHPLPPVPVGRGGKSSKGGGGGGVSWKPCGITLPGGWEGAAAAWVVTILRWKAGVMRSEVEAQCLCCSIHPSVK